MQSPPGERVHRRDRDGRRMHCAAMLCSMQRIRWALWRCGCRKHDHCRWVQNGVGCTPRLGGSQSAGAICSGQRPLEVHSHFVCYPPPPPPQHSDAHRLALADWALAVHTSTMLRLTSLEMLAWSAVDLPTARPKGVTTAWR